MCTIVRASLIVQQLGEDDMHVQAHTLLYTVYHFISILCINRKIILTASQLSVKWALFLTACCMSDGAVLAVCGVKLRAEWKNWAIFCFYET